MSIINNQTNQFDYNESLIKLADKAVENPTEQNIAEFSKEYFSENYNNISDAVKETLRKKFQTLPIDSSSSSKDTKIRTLFKFLYSNKRFSPEDLLNIKNKLAPPPSSSPVSDLEKIATVVSTAKKVNKILESVSSVPEIGRSLIEGGKEVITADTASTLLSGLSLVRKQATRTAVGSKVITASVSGTAASTTASVGAIAGSIAVVASIGIALIGTGILLNKAYLNYIDTLLTALPSIKEVEIDLALKKSLFPKAPSQTLKERRIEIAVNNIILNSRLRGIHLSKTDIAGIQEIVTKKLYPDSSPAAIQSMPTSPANETITERDISKEKNKKNKSKISDASAKTVESTAQERESSSQTNKAQKKNKKSKETLKGEKSKKINISTVTSQTLTGILSEAVDSSVEITKDLKKNLADTVADNSQANKKVVKQTIKAADAVITEGNALKGIESTVTGLKDMTAASSMRDISQAMNSVASGTRALGSGINSLEDSHILHEASEISGEVATASKIGSVLFDTASSVYKAIMLLINHVEPPSIREVEAYINLQSALQPHLPKPSVKEMRIKMTVDTIEIKNRLNGIKLTEDDLNKIKILVENKLYPKTESRDKAKKEDELEERYVPDLSSKRNLSTRVITTISGGISDSLRATDVLLTEDRKKFHTISRIAEESLSGTIHPLVSEITIVTNARNVIKSAKNLVNIESPNKSASFENLGISASKLASGAKDLGISLTDQDPLKSAANTLNSVGDTVADVALAAGTVLTGIAILRSRYEEYIDSMIIEPPSIKEVKIDLALTNSLFPNSPRKTIAERRVEMTLNAIQENNRRKGIELNRKDLEKMEQIIAQKLYPEGLPPDPISSPEIEAPTPTKRKVTYFDSSPRFRM